MARLKRGYTRRKLRLTGSRLKPLTTKRLLNKYSYAYGRLTEKEKSELAKDYENYGIEMLSPKELRKAKGLTNEELRRNIERFFGMKSGTYQKARKNIFIENYIDALKKSGVSVDMQRTVRSLLKEKDPRELALLIKSGKLPSAFIFYETHDEGERAILLEDDLLTWIMDELSAKNQKEKDDELKIDDLE